MIFGHSFHVIIPLRYKKKKKPTLYINTDVFCDTKTRYSIWKI